MNEAGPPTFTVAHDQTIVRPEEQAFLMARHELLRFRTRVDGLKKHMRHPVSDAPTWAAGFFGAAVSAVAGLLTTLTGIKHPPLPVLVVFWTGSIAFPICFGLMLLFSRGAKKLREAEVDEVCGEFDSLEARAFPTQAQATEGSA